MQYQKPVVLIADDDEEDFELWKRAFLEAHPGCDLRWAEHGDRVLDYLHRRNGFEDPQDSPRPNLIVMDLNMPFKDGRATLKELKASEDFADIPVVTMTLSTNPEDAKFCYRHGASSVINKPFGLAHTAKIFGSLSKYWFDTVRLP